MIGNLVSLEYKVQREYIWVCEIHVLRCKVPKKTMPAIQCSIDTYKFYFKYQPSVYKMK